MTEETQPPQPAVRSERRGAILLVRIDRPEVRNAISPAVSTECAAQFDPFAADPWLRVAILTGTGGQAYCAGSDLRPQRTKVPRPATGFGGLTERFDLDKPIIAALSPAAVRACKQLGTRGGAEPSVEAAMRAQADYPAVKAMFASGDAREGVCAFREKRAPEWRS